MRKRVEEEESNKLEIQPKDYEVVLKQAFADKDKHALEALKLDLVKGQGKVPEAAKASTAAAFSSSASAATPATSASR